MVPPHPQPPPHPHPITHTRTLLTSAPLSSLSAHPPSHTCSSTQVPIDGQPASIVSDLEDMARKYIKGANAIILAVRSAFPSIALLGLS